MPRNPEIQNIPVWVLPNIWRLGQVRDTEFDTNVCNEMLLNAAKREVTAFTLSELLMENQQSGGGGGGKVTSLPTQIRSKDN